LSIRRELEDLRILPNFYLIRRDADLVITGTAFGASTDGLDYPILAPLNQPSSPPPEIP